MTKITDEFAPWDEARLTRQSQIAGRLLYPKMKQAVRRVVAAGDQQHPADQAIAPVIVLQAMMVPLIASADACLKKFLLGRADRHEVLRGMVLAIFADAISHSDKCFNERGRALGDGELYDYH
jgi:hypothetical protein